MTDKLTTFQQQIKQIRKKYFVITLIANIIIASPFIILTHHRIEASLVLLLVLLVNILINNNLIKKFTVEIEKIRKETSADEVDKLKQQKMQLKANEKFRKEFIGNVAHELKTPIFNIQGYISTLLDGAIYDPNVNIKYLERTDKNVQRLVTLVKDLDTISKLETGKLKPDFSVFDISEIITDVFEILEFKSIEYGVSLYTDVKAGTMVYADKEKITEVLHNLVLNSIIYGKKGGETHVNVEEKGNKIYVSVIDNGIGIDKIHLPHIFERFYRVDKSRSRERGGSGLGLSIVKHILDVHGESITVESQLNVGSKFTFSLQKAYYNETNNQKED